MTDTPPQEEAAVNVSLQDAYAEACQALGESVVQQRLVAKHLQAQAAEIAALRAAVRADS